MKTVEKQILCLLRNVNSVSQVINNCLKSIPHVEPSQHLLSDVVELSRQATSVFSNAYSKAENTRNLNEKNVKLANEIDLLHDEIHQSNSKIGALQKFVNQLKAKIENTVSNNGKVFHGSTDSQVKYLEAQVEELKNKLYQNAVAEADYMKDIEILNEVYSKTAKALEETKQIKKQQDQRIVKLLLERKYLKRISKQTFKSKKSSNWPKIRKEKFLSYPKMPTRIYETAVVKVSSVHTPRKQETPRSDLAVNQIETLENKMAMLELENNELRMSVNRLGDNISDLSSTQESLLQFTAEIKAKSKIIATLRLEISVLEQTLALKNVQINDLFDEMANKTNELETLRITLNQLKSGKGSLVKFTKTKLLDLLKSDSEKPEAITKLESSISLLKISSTLFKDDDTLPFKYIAENKLLKSATLEAENTMSRFVSKIFKTGKQLNANWELELIKKEEEFKNLLDKERMNFAQKWRLSQIESSNLLRKLEARLEELEKKLNKDRPGKNKGQILDSDQIIHLKLFGSSASIRVPITIFENGLDSIILHVTFPAHNLQLAPDISQMQVIPDESDENLKLIYYDLSQLETNTDKGQFYKISSSKNSDLLSCT